LEQFRMTEQTGQQDVSPDTDPAPEAPTVEPVAATELPAAVDPVAIHAATEAHSAAVTAAHNTLSQRLENAYQIFASELANAYRTWETDVNRIKSAVGLIEGDIGGTGNGNGDATRSV
jgi:hypothetical protein